VNKNLYDKEIEIPKHIRENLKKCFSMAKNVDENSEGYKRNKELQTERFIGYKQLKRIKNFFDNFKGKQTDPSFILNGGVIMKNWVNNELRRMRDFEYLTKRNKMDAGMQNQFIKPHEKKDYNNVRTSQEHSKTVDKYNAAVTESLRRINELISKL
jgi:hypothetical protein